MKKYWTLYLAKFAKLTVRERVLVYATAAVLVIFIADALFLGPLTQQRNNVASLLQSQRDEIAALDQQLEEMRQRKAADPDAAAKDRIARIEQQIGEIDANLKSVQDTLVPPERMAELLRELLTRNRRLNLLNLKTLPATPLIDRARQLAERARQEAAHSPPESPAGTAEGADGSPVLAAATVPSVSQAPVDPPQPEANLFKHGVEITLEGAYPDFVHYLEALEGLPWQMYWGGLRVDAENYPRVTLVLTLHTLSLDPAWLKL